MARSKSWLMFSRPLPILLILHILACLSLAADDKPQPSPSPDAQYIDDKNFRNAIMMSSNTYRLQHNVKELTWNETLVKSSEEYAKQCIFEHSTVGENLATGYSSAVAAVRAWGDERKDYDFKKGKFSMESGHFTQLVWKETESVGCGRYQCGDPPKSAKNRAFGWYIVCQYHPAGNVVGAFKDNVPKQVNDVNLTTTDPSTTQAPDVTQTNRPRPTEIYPGQPLSAAGRTALLGSGYLWMVVCICLFAGLQVL